MGPRSAFWQNKQTLTACCQTVEKWRNMTGWVLASLVCWMRSAGGINSPRACRVKGQMFKRDLTTPHTDRPPRPPDTVFTLSYDSRPLLEQTVLWVSGWLLWSTEFTVCDLCCFTQAMLTFLQRFRYWKLSNTDISALRPESRWRSTGPYCVFSSFCSSFEHYFRSTRLLTSIFLDLQVHLYFYFQYDIQISRPLKLSQTFEWLFQMFFPIDGFLSCR